MVCCMVLKFSFAVFLIVGMRHYAVLFVIDLLFGLFVSVCTLSVTTWLGVELLI